MKEIRKKVSPEFFGDIKKGIKNFEIRKDEDDVQPGDFLILEEYIIGNYPPFSCRYTGQSVYRKVDYVLRNRSDLGLMEGYCIIGMKDADKPQMGHYVVSWNDECLDMQIVAGPAEIHQARKLMKDCVTERLVKLSNAKDLDEAAGMYNQAISEEEETEGLSVSGFGASIRYGCGYKERYQIVGYKGSR